MASPRNGGVVSPSGTHPWQVASAVPSGGYLLKDTTTAATRGVHGFKKDLCGAGEEPCGFSFTGNNHPVSGAARTNEMVGVCPLEDGMIVDFPISDTNEEITLGAELETAAGGLVKIKDGAGWIVGKAIEAVDINTGGYVRAVVEKVYRAV